MKRKILISAVLNQIQAGIVENGRLVEYYLERAGSKRLVGNIYKGRVENILPGMAAAFIDLGLEKNAFLYLKDLPEHQSQNLKKGDTLLVQVTKEPSGSKGPRVTTEIALAGRYLVLLPFQDNIGVSRQITVEEERERLYGIASQLRPENMGLIVRTVGEGCSQEEFAADLARLKFEWQKISDRQTKQTSTPLLYQDDDVIRRILRDLYEPETSKIVVDSEELQAKAEKTLAVLGIEPVPQIECYQGKVDLFTAFGLDKELQRARNNRVWLDCGGYLIFNQTEALLSIDVNTGKYVGSQDLPTTVLKTNLQAAEEIPYQLRLRNVGGIVIIDFIDMALAEHREAVLERLGENLSLDKTRTKLLGFTKLGLVELTRQKNKRTLSQLLETECTHCHGKGRLLADETIAGEIGQKVIALAKERESEAILIRCHSAVAAHLIGSGGINLHSLEKQAKSSVFVRGDDSLSRHDYKLSAGFKEQIQAQAYPVQVGERLQLTITEPHAKAVNNGVGRVDGFVIECLQCRPFVGQTVEVQITELHKTNAVARLINSD